VVDRLRAAPAPQRLLEEGAAAAADLEQDVVGAELEALEDRAEGRPVVGRVAVARPLRRARRATGGAVGEPVAECRGRRRFQERGRDRVGEPAEQLAVVPERAAEPAQLEHNAVAVAAQLELALGVRVPVGLLPFGCS
jgi:hypothetical protein